MYLYELRNEAKLETFRQRLEARFPKEEISFKFVEADLDIYLPWHGLHRLYVRTGHSTIIIQEFPGNCSWLVAHSLDLPESDFATYEERFYPYIVRKLSVAEAIAEMMEYSHLFVSMKQDSYIVNTKIFMERNYNLLQGNKNFHSSNLVVLLSKETYNGHHPRIVDDFDLIGEPF